MFLRRLVRELSPLLRGGRRDYSTQVGAQYKLSYFDFRGLGEHIRLLLVVAGVAFEDHRVPREQWDQLKAKYPYDKLPILTVDGKELSQSLAIARFLGKRHSLSPQDPFLEARADQAVGMVAEVRDWDFRAFVIEKKDEVRREALRKHLGHTVLPKYYAELETLLGETAGSFLTGPTPVWHDFYVANWLEIWEEVAKPGLLSAYPKLKALKDAVFAIPAVRDYVATRPKTFI